MTHPLNSLLTVHGYLNARTAQAQGSRECWRACDVHAHTA
jgi:hypothetical protein